MTTQNQYKEVLEEAKELMLKKNQDYGDSWRDMRLSSITDQILVKIKRVRQIEESGKQAIEDSIRSEYLDILNYAIFGIIKLDETYECKEHALENLKLAYGIDKEAEHNANLYNDYPKELKDSVNVNNIPMDTLDNKLHSFYIVEYDIPNSKVHLECSKCKMDFPDQGIGNVNRNHGSVKGYIDYLNKKECKEEIN